MLIAYFIVNEAVTWLTVSAGWRHLVW